MRIYNPKLIIKAAKLAFEGNTHEKIAKQLKINPNTITNWRKTDIWKKTQDKLVEVYIEETVKK